MKVRVDSGRWLARAPTFLTNFLTVAYLAFFFTNLPGAESKTIHLSFLILPFLCVRPFLVARSVLVAEFQAKRVFHELSRAAGPAQTRLKVVLCYKAKANASFSAACEVVPLQNTSKLTYQHRRN
jgi:hypothetical protein